MTETSERVEAGAWYQGRDYNEIRRVFGHKAAEYLRIPRRAALTITDRKGDIKIVFQTMGDQSRAIGIDGLETNTPSWPVKWLRKVKSSCNISGKQYRVDPSWKSEGSRRQDFPNNKLKGYLHPELAGKIVTASHESFSGISIWCQPSYGANNVFACIPRMYLTEIPETPTKVDLSDANVIQYANGRISFEEIEDRVKEGPMKNVRDELIALGVFPQGKTDKVEQNKEPIGQWVDEDNGKCAVDNKENSMSSNKVNILDEKVRMLESRLREVEEGPEDGDVDLDNDLDNSMVLDLPPNIAEWAKEAGIGLEDMIPLAKEICALQSNMVLGIQEEVFETERHNSFQDSETQARIQETEQAKVKASLAEVVSGFRHETFQVFIKWVAGASTISYLAHQASGLFL